MNLFNLETWLIIIVWITIGIFGFNSLLTNVDKQKGDNNIVVKIIFILLSPAFIIPYYSIVFYKKIKFN